MGHYTKSRSEKTDNPFIIYAKESVFPSEDLMPRLSRHAVVSR